MIAMASQITGVSIVCSTICSDTDQRKHQSSAPMAFVRGIHRWPMDFLDKGPVTRKKFPFDGVIMKDLVSHDTQQLPVPVMIPGQWSPEEFILRHFRNKCLNLRTSMCLEIACSKLHHQQINPTTCRILPNAHRNKCPWSMIKCCAVITRSIFSKIVKIDTP